ncbi:MAG: beta-ketoacyl synthase N-terminal-like domain-containing protein [Luteolibacter sp.]
MSVPISIHGCGVVSPAGWGMAPFMEALASGKRPELSELSRSCGAEIVRSPVLKVPEEGSTTPKFARLRRTSPISRFAAAAAVEALGDERLTSIRNGELRVGIVFTLMNGCVNYSHRFYREALADPATASPILFPETVFNAPSSHLSALLDSTAPNDTLIGDGNALFSGLDLAAEWICRGEVDGCLVVASEEIDWLSTEALRLYSGNAIAAEGAAAFYLQSGPGPVNLLRLPDPISLSTHSRSAAAEILRTVLSPSPDALLVDGQCGDAKFDAPESATWADWTGPHCSPRKLMGEGLGVSAGWQLAAAVEAIRSGRHAQAAVIGTTAHQQCGGVLIGR